MPTVSGVARGNAGPPSCDAIRVVANAVMALAPKRIKDGIVRMSIRLPGARVHCTVL